MYAYSGARETNARDNGPWLHVKEEEDKRRVSDPGIIVERE